MTATEGTCPAASTPPQHRWVLGTYLLVAEIVALGLSWTLAAIVEPHGPSSGSAALAFLATTVGVVLLLLVFPESDASPERRLSHLNMGRIARASAFAGIAAMLSAERFGLQLPAVRAALGAALTFIALSAVRAGGRQLLRWTITRQPRLRVVIVGANDESAELESLVHENPDLGLEIVAVADDPGRVVSTLHLHGADSVIIAVTAFDTKELNKMVRHLLEAGVHVRLSTGLRGFEHRRLRTQPLAREPFYCLEPTPSFSAWQLAVKRTLDVVVAGLGLLVISPLLAVMAVAVKLGDRGSVLYMQTRIGRRGLPFRVVKFRTMIPNAHEQVDAIAAVSNGYHDGPLFKSENDPRVTRVGRFLRATSIDELPQLLNVLRGEMSLVGPRPALPNEVEEFDGDLLIRHRVRPGITGLWQVEAKGRTSFYHYRRLDLFYVENWSLRLDFWILLATAPTVVSTALRELIRHGRAKPRTSRAALRLAPIVAEPTDRDRTVVANGDGPVRNGMGSVIGGLSATMRAEATLPLHPAEGAGSFVSAGDVPANDLLPTPWLRRTPPADR